VQMAKLRQNRAKLYDAKDRHMRPNDPSSATAATRRADCNRDDPPPFAAAHG